MMDFSQLPKMSDTPKPPSTKPDEIEQDDDVVLRSAAAEPLGVEFALIGVGIGLLLLLFFSGPINIFHQLFNPAALPTAIDVDGSTIPYVQTAFFKTDLAFTAFAITLVLEGALLGFTRAIWVRYGVASVALIVTLLNLWAFVVTRSLIGPQIANAIAIIISLVVAVTSVKSARPMQSQRY